MTSNYVANDLFVTVKPQVFTPTSVQTQTHVIIF